MASVTGNFDGLMDNIENQLREAAEEKLAEQVVATVREHDLASADQVDLQIDAEGQEIGIDAARVIARAKQMLGE